MENVQIFANDTATKNEVKSYILTFLEKQVIEKAFSGLPITDVVEAKKVIEKAFDAMDTEFVMEHPKSPVNEME